MKSAYEIAMEKMNQESGPTRALSDSEKAQIAEIDSKYDAQAAQTRLDFDERIATADPQARAGVEQELALELGRIEERRESEKDAVWKSDS